MKLLFGRLQISLFRHDDTKVKEMQANKSDSGSLESAIMKLRGMSSEIQTIITSLICRLADAEGISDNADRKPHFQRGARN